MNALARTVDRAWDDLDSVKLANILNRWWLVLDVIIDDNGGNRTEESKRGKLSRDPPEEVEIIQEDLNAKTTEADAIDAAEADELDTVDEKLACELGGSFC